jgi:putative ABC transport system permease protein
MFSIGLAFKNIVSRKSSVVIVLFIAFSIALLVVSNAIFDGTGNGIETTFADSFTGDLVVRPYADFPLSLFGDETPATGLLSEIPLMIPFSEIFNTVNTIEGISGAIPQITGQAVMNFTGGRLPVVLFGVYGDQYMKIMRSITLVEGTPCTEEHRGIMLSRSMLARIKKETGVQLQCGDNIQLMAGSGNSLAMRSIPVTAVYAYPVQNDVLDRIVLVSPDTLRELTGIVSASSRIEEKIDSSKQNLLDDSKIDDLFASSSVPESVISPVTSKSAALSPSDTMLSGKTSWNFIVCRVKPGYSAGKMIRKLNTVFRKKGWPVQAVDWRTAAGMSAQYLYWMRLIFNIGIIVILGTGFIVVNNTLVISALDRSQETGTMRAIGADRRFVAIQFLLETAMLTVSAGIAGCLIGVGLNGIIADVHIQFHNIYLIQLFGGISLVTQVTSANILRCMVLSSFLALIGWLYPVRIALGISPVEAMRGLH